MSYPITNAVTTQLIARLSDAANNGADGWNAVYNSLAPGYGIPANMAIDFAGDTRASSKNFVLGDIDVTAWEETSAFNFPLMTLFGMRSINQNWQKFHLFSGDIDIGINVFLSWENTRVLLDFSPWADCVEEAMFTLLNRARNANPADQDWSEEVVYNGDLELKRSPIILAGESWRQLLAFKATFEGVERGET